MILVTGGSGFVGLNVVEQLLARGDEVSIYDLSPPPRGFTGKFTFEPGDTADSSQVEKFFLEIKPQGVIHLAAITAGAERDAREPRRIAEVNLVGTLNVLEAARRHGVRRFVHASTGAVFGAAGAAEEPLDEERDRPLPESMYGITKYAAERAVLRLASPWNLDVLAGRLAVAYGRWEYSSGVRDTISAPTRLARMAQRGEEAVIPALGAIDFIYGPDVAGALIALLDAGAPAHRLYHLGAGAPFSLPQWCALLAKRLPKFRWRESERAEECNVSVLASVKRAPFSTRRLAALGWKPRYGAAAAAADFMNWLGEHHEFAN
jgi:nucleoside-diphosphate-sugar epimerase